MAVFYGNSTTNSNYRGRLEMWESATDVTNNTSTISWEFKVFRSDNYNSSYDRNTGNNFTLIADGSARTSPSPYTNFRAWMGANGQYESTANTWVSSTQCGTFDVDHNADGSKSFYFEAKYWSTSSDSVGSSSKPLTVGGTFYCTTFARASTVYPNYTNVTLGNAVGINVSRASSDFRHTIRWWYEGGHTGTIDTNVEGYTEWTPTLVTFAPLMPNTSSHSVAIVCDTYNGSTLVGSSTCYVNLIVPQNNDTLPVISRVTTQVVDGYNGLYLQNRSKCKITITAAAKSSASIASYKINGLTNAPNPYTSAMLTESGTKTYTITVYDSRGFSATTTARITVTEYSAPKMTNISVARCLQDGTLSSSGTYLSVYAKENHTSVGSNSATMQVDYRLSTETSYTRLTDNLQSETTTVLGGGNVLSQRNYYVRLTITDTVGNTAEAVLLIPADAVSINERANNKGVGIGTYADEDDAFKVNPNWVSSMGALHLTALLPKSTAIATNTNLNSLMTYGFYRCGTNSTAATLSNCPTQYAFLMIVYELSGKGTLQVSGTWTYAAQEITNVFGDKFVRAGNTGSSGTMSWGSWRQITMTNV